MGLVNIPSEYVSNLEIDGLKGRVLEIPSNEKKTKLLFIYGHHSSLERWWGLMQALRHYGTVTLPDLPGFGGMDSFYKIGKEPTLDNMADYLAKFINKHYEDDEKIVIAGMSFGFVVATRMLQTHPEMANRVKNIISIVGFTNYRDFLFSPLRRFLYKNFSRLLSHKYPSIIFRYTALQPFVLNSLYGRTHNAKHKFKNAQTKEEIDAIKETEVRLWHDNDPRTWSYTTVIILTLKQSIDNKIKLPVWHVGVSEDHFFDNKIVESNLAKIYQDVVHIKVEAKMHAPSVIADEEAAAGILPDQLKEKLANL